MGEAPRIWRNRQVEAEEVAGDELGGETLGGGHPDLRSGMGVDDRVGLARDGRPVGVADRDHLGVLFAGVPDRHEDVGNLPPADLAGLLFACVATDVLFKA